MAEGKAKELLKTYFGYDAFRPAQEVPVRSLVRNEDILAIMPTGAGKSICFQIPSLLKEGITLVFSPLISLMQDQVDGLRLQRIPAVYLNSTLSREELNRYLYLIRSGRVKLVYLAPERLRSEGFQRFLQEMPISQVIIDEAHCVSQWGHDFRPSYRLIEPFIRSLRRKPVVGAFTASATKEVQQDMKELLGLGDANVHITGFDRPNLVFSVVHASQRMEFVLDYVKRHSKEYGVIYCSTRKDVERVYETLVKAGISAGYYHGGLSDEVRKFQQDRYADDQVQVMVATNAFGMGIDKSNVRYVLHYQMPRNMEGYYQEAGRAGRDGLPAQCILLYSGQDVRVHKYLIEQSIDDVDRRNIELERLQSMIDYCFSTYCLRRHMLGYFGEKVTWERCDNCGSCLKPTTEVDVTEEAKAIIQAILHTEERFGVTMITAIVGGERTERIVRSGFHRSPVFGSLVRLEEGVIKGRIRELIELGYIRSSGGKYPILTVTQKGEQVLAGRLQVLVKAATVMPKGTKKRGYATKAQQGGLFEALRQHRKRLSEQQGIRPYLIFSDTVLIDMASRRPRTLADMQEVKGVGDAKLQRYGLSFLKVINDFQKEER